MKGHMCRDDNGKEKEKVKEISRRLKINGANGHSQVVQIAAQLV
jgi:hypothetical protein